MTLFEIRNVCASYTSLDVYIGSKKTTYHCFSEIPDFYLHAEVIKLDTNNNGADLVITIEDGMLDSAKEIDYFEIYKKLLEIQNTFTNSKYHTFELRKTKEDQTEYIVYKYHTNYCVNYTFILTSIKNNKLCYEKMYFGDLANLIMRNHYIIVNGIKD